MKNNCIDCENNLKLISYVSLKTFKLKYKLIRRECEYHRKIWIDDLFKRI
jgi:hypothetical protein